MADWRTREGVNAECVNGSAQNSDILLSVMIAVLAHKGLAAFALGTALMQSGMSTIKFWTFVALFSAGSPVGCARGGLPVAIGTYICNVFLCNVKLHMVILE